VLQQGLAGSPGVQIANISFGAQNSDGSIPVSFSLDRNSTDGLYSTKITTTASGSGSTPPASTDSITQVIDSLSNEDMTVTALDGSNKTLATITLTKNSGAQKLVYPKSSVFLVFATATSKLSQTFKISDFGQLQSDGYLTHANNADGSISIGFWNLDASGSGKGSGKGGAAKIAITQNIYALKDEDMTVTALDASNNTIATITLAANNNAYKSLQYGPSTAVLVFTTATSKLTQTFKIKDVEQLQTNGWLTNQKNSDGSISLGSYNLDWTGKGGGLKIGYNYKLNNASAWDLDVSVVKKDNSLSSSVRVTKDNKPQNIYYDTNDIKGIQISPVLTTSGAPIAVLNTQILYTDDSKVQNVLQSAEAIAFNNIDGASNDKSTGVHVYFYSSKTDLSKSSLDISVPNSSSSGSTTPPASTGSALYYVQSTSSGTLELSKTHAYSSTNPARSYPYGILTQDGTTYDVIVQANTLPNPDGFTSPIALIMGTDYQNLVASYGSILKDELPADAQYANVYAFAHYFSSPSSVNVVLTGTVSTAIGTLATGRLNDTDDIVIVPGSVEQAHELALAELPDLGLVSNDLGSADYTALKTAFGSNTSVTTALGSDTDGYIFKTSDIQAITA
jgi:hypothetical protein